MLKKHKNVLRAPNAAKKENPLHRRGSCHKLQEQGTRQWQSQPYGSVLLVQSSCLVQENSAPNSC